MKVTRVSGRWRPMVGVAILGVFAFGLTLQGAPTKDKRGETDKRVGAGQLGLTADRQVTVGPGIPKALEGKLEMLEQPTPAHVLAALEQVTRLIPVLLVALDSPARVRPAGIQGAVFLLRPRTVQIASAAACRVRRMVSISIPNFNYRRSIACSSYRHSVRHPPRQFLDRRAYPATICVVVSPCGIARRREGGTEQADSCMATDPAGVCKDGSSARAGVTLALQRCC